MKRIAFILKLFQENSFHGGGEKLFYKLITRLIKDNNSIDIYCSKSDITEFSGINEIIVVDKPYDHTDPVSMEAFYDRVKELIKDKNYDFVISENITPPVNITFLQGHSLIHRQKKLKSPFESFLYNFRSAKRRRIKYQQKWMEQGYRKIFVPSNILKADIIENFNVPENKISVVYPGVDIPDSEVKTKDNDYFTFALSAPGFKIKGGYIFIKALKILRKKGYDFRAKVIYPKANKNQWLKLLVKLYNLKKNIEFLGFQKDMQNFYSSIDCIVMPSIEDTFGLVALEAMANKKFCIISSNAGASEIIQDGINGFVFKYGKYSAESLAEKMMFILDYQDKVDELDKKAFETAEFYNWDRTYSEFIKELGFGAKKPVSNPIKS